MRLRVTEDAASDLTGIKAFLSEQSVVVAERVLVQIAHVVDRLRTFPRLGHLGTVQGTLERIVPRTPYVIVYRIDVGDGDDLVVLRVHHAAQPPTRGPPAHGFWMQQLADFSVLGLACSGSRMDRGYRLTLGVRSARHLCGCG